MAEIKYDIKRGASIYRQIHGSRLKSWILRGKIKKGEATVWRSGLSGSRKPEELEELIPYFAKYEKSQLGEKMGRRASRRMPLRRTIKSVLIIDDKEDLCLLLADALTKQKYNVSIANTKKEGINLIKKEPPDLIFLDLKLPDGDGMEILPQINEMKQKPIVNIITAYGDEERRRQAQKMGAHGFLDKPFTEDDILRTIRKFSKVK